VKKILSPDPFPITFYVQLGGNPKWLVKQLGDIDFTFDQTYLDAADGFMVPVETRVGVWVKDPDDRGTISHELLHAVKHATSYLDIDDEETECYLMGWLTKELT